MTTPPDHVPEAPPESFDELLDRALDLADGARAGLLERIMRADPELGERLRRHVQVLAERPDFLTQPPTVPLDIFDERADAGEKADDPVDDREWLQGTERIGGYHLHDIIGRGGMGVVYEASQESPRRRVALKLLRAAWVGDDVRRRFRKEAEILGRLRHPAIAQVYEAGVAGVRGESVPYLAMELVPRARTIIEYAREHVLGLAARLDLFRQVCAAVHHAHEQGVVHRDLKPANILIDGTGAVKVIDFGIARLVDPEREATAATLTRGVVGTIAYMSPEQLGEKADVDARTDVYALGIILYELLCGGPPYDLKDTTLPEALRIVLHQPPRSPRALEPSLESDLETIILKALRKTKDDRYASAADLSADIKRYIAHEPIAARSPGPWYRLRLFARRRPGAVAASVLVLVTLGAGAGVSAVLYQRGERLRRAEEQQREELEKAREELNTVRAALGSAAGTPAAGGGERRGVGFTPFTEGIVSTVQDSLATAETDEERARVLLWAVETLRRLEPFAVEDRRLTETLASTYVDLGDAYGREWDAGPEKVQAAVEAYRRAEELFAGVNRSLPEDDRVLRRLTSAQIDLSQTLRKLDRLDESWAVADRAVGNGDRLLERSPDDPAAGRRLVNALWARSDALIATDRNAEGLADSERASAISRALRQAEPENAGNADAAAWSDFRTALWRTRVPGFDPRGALDAFTSSTDARLEHCRLAPGDAGALFDLLQFTFGEMHWHVEQGDVESAIRRQRLIIETAHAQFDEYGFPRRVVKGYAESVTRLVELLRDVGRDADARAVAEEQVKRLQALAESSEPSESLEKTLAAARRLVDGEA